MQILNWVRYLPLMEFAFRANNTGFECIGIYDTTAVTSTAAALTTSDPPRPISYASTRSLIRRTLMDPPPVNPQTVEVYSGFSWSKGLHGH